MSCLPAEADPGARRRTLPRMLSDSAASPGDTPARRDTATPAPPHPEVAALVAGGTPDAEAVGAFVAGHRFPLVEPGRATFAWFGEAERVELLRWIHAGVDRTPLAPLPGTRLWLGEVPVEDGGRFEYKLSVTRDGHEEWILDPLNRQTAEDPFGSNSVCRTHGYERPAWTEPQGAPKGRLVPLAVDSEVFGERREELLYLPAGRVPGEPLALLVVHDGRDFDHFADLSTCLDNLIHSGDVPPVVAALIQAGDRMEEYPRGRRHARYVVDELLPAIEAVEAIDPEPARRVILGASLGAVASLATLLRRPGAFGGAVLQSGTFVLDERRLAGREHPVYARAARLMRALRRAPSLPAARIHVSTGELEGLAKESRALAELLDERGVEVRFESSWDGHHWHNWRDGLRDALTWTLGRDRTRRVRAWEPGPTTTEGGGDDDG